MLNLQLAINKNSFSYCKDSQWQFEIIFDKRNKISHCYAFIFINFYPLNLKHTQYFCCLIVAKSKINISNAAQHRSCLIPNLFSPALYTPGCDFGIGNSLLAWLKFFGYPDSKVKAIHIFNV